MAEESVETNLIDVTERPNRRQVFDEESRLRPLPSRRVSDIIPDRQSRSKTRVFDEVPRLQRAVSADAAARITEPTFDIYQRFAKTLNENKTGKSGATRTSRIHRRQERKKKKKRVSKSLAPKTRNSSNSTKHDFPKPDDLYMGTEPDETSGADQSVAGSKTNTNTNTTHSKRQSKDLKDMIDAQLLPLQDAQDAEDADGVESNENNNNNNNNNSNSNNKNSIGNYGAVMGSGVEMVSSGNDGKNGERRSKELLLGKEDEVTTKTPLLQRDNSPTNSLVVDSDSQHPDSVKIFLKNYANLEQYYPLFMEKNYNTMKILIHLTNNDLIDMGIDNVQHRRIILKKIEEIEMDQMAYKYNKNKDKTAETSGSACCCICM